MSKKQYYALAAVLSAALGAAVQQQLFSPNVMGLVVMVVAMLKAISPVPEGKP